jgi:hypothetical protein
VGGRQSGRGRTAWFAIRKNGKTVSVANGGMIGGTVS